MRNNNSWPSGIQSADQTDAWHFRKLNFVFRRCSRSLFTGRCFICIISMLFLFLSLISICSRDRLRIYICNRFRRKKQNFLRLHWLCDGPLKGGCEDKNVDATRFMTCFYNYKKMNFTEYNLFELRAVTEASSRTRKRIFFSMLSLFIGQINRTYAMCVLSITLYWPALKGSVYLGLVTLNYII